MIMLKIRTWLAYHIMPKQLRKPFKLGITEYIDLIERELARRENGEESEE